MQQTNAAAPRRSGTGRAAASASSRGTARAPLPLPLRGAASAWTHRPSVVSEALIEHASSNPAPVTPDRFVRSEPARSTR